MVTLNKWITVLAVILSRWGMCTAVGLLVGLFGGWLLMLVHCSGATGALSPVEIVKVGLMIAVPGFLLALWILVALQRYPLAAVFFPLLLNAALTGIATAAVVSALNAWAQAVILGLLVGMLVGRLLCLLRACPKGDRRGVQ